MSGVSYYVPTMQKKVLKCLHLDRDILKDKFTK